MRRGVATYVAIILFVGLLLPIGMLWAPGLLGLLSMTGSVLLYPVAVLLGIGVLLFVVGAVLNARGTAHAREHVMDMLPGAIVVLAIVAIVSLAR